MYVAALIPVGRMHCIVCERVLQYPKTEVNDIAVEQIVYLTSLVLITQSYTD